MTLGSSNTTKKQNNKDSMENSSLRELKKKVKIKTLTDLFHIFSYKTNYPLQMCYSKGVNQAFYSSPVIFT
jgi:hypothetical protein